MSQKPHLWATTAGSRKSVTSGGWPLPWTNPVSTSCFPGSHPRGGRELRAHLPLNRGPVFVAGSPESLPLLQKFTVHGSFEERREMLTHTPTRTHMHTHVCTMHSRTRTRTHMHSIAGHGVAFPRRTQKVPVVGPEPSRNTGRAATFRHKRASLPGGSGEAVTERGPRRACSGVAPGTRQEPGFSSPRRGRPSQSHRREAGR